MELRKAARQKAKLRVGVSGPSGSGKTYSALLLAKSIAKGDMGKVAVIDTENGSADLYSHLGEYNVLTLQEPYSPENYVKAIKACEEAGMEVVIIDSVTHEWDGKGGCLEINDLIAKTRFKGNTWAAWSETTPRHQKFIEAITQSKVHIITTARSKTDMVQTDDKKIKKVGMKEIQREGFEYELTLNFTLDRDGHYATTSKDRTELFIDKDPFMITEQTGKILLDWAEQGVDPKAIQEAEKKAREEKAREEAIKVNKNKIMALLGMLKVTMPTEKTEVKAFVEKVILEKTQLPLADENLQEIVSRLEVLVTERNESLKNNQEDLAGQI